MSKTIGPYRLNPRGDYNHAADPLYSLLDLVSDGGGSFVYINDTPSNEPTSSASHWQQIASQGATGPSAYDAAVAGEYTGTEAEFNAANAGIEAAVDSTEAATLTALAALDSNATWTKDQRNPAEYYPSPLAPLYYKIEGSLTQSGTGDPSPTNIRPITPWMANGAKAKLANNGKNLLPNTASVGVITDHGVTFTKNADGSVLANGTASGGDAVFSLAGDGATPVMHYKAKQHVISKNTTGAVHIWCISSQTGSWAPVLQLYGHETVKAFSPTSNGYITEVILLVPNGETVSNVLVKPQLELGSVATPYEPYVGSTAELTAPEEIAAGWMDNRGNGQKTWLRHVFDGTETIIVSVPHESVTLKSRFRYSFPVQVVRPITSAYIAEFVCSHFKAISSDDGWGGGGTGVAAESSIDTVEFYVWDSDIGIIPEDDFETKLTKFKAFLSAQYAAGTPVTVAYKPLVNALTPITASLNTIPATDLTQERLNVFTSSMNGVLTYPKSKVGENKKFWNSQLWQKTPSGNPVSVYPVPESPLYPKVSGTFTQSGTGDPSPSNIRPITPWLASGATATVKRTGKNLLPFPYYDASGTVKNGITMTANQATGMLTFSGTASANSAFFVMGEVDTEGNRKPLKAGTYTLKGCPTGGDAGTYKLGIIVGWKHAPLYFDFGAGVTFTLSEDTPYGYAFIEIMSGVTVNDLVFYPQLEYGSVATPYEPYTESEITLTAPQEILAGWMDNEGQGQVTWGRYVFDGTEEAWGTLGIRNNTTTFYYGIYNKMFGYQKSVMSHFNNVNELPWSTEAVSGLYSDYPEDVVIYVSYGTTATTLADFKAYLAAQYAAGTPVTIYYQLATPVTLTTAIAPLPALPQLDRYTQRQNVVTTSAGVLEVTYAEHSGRSLDTAKSEKMMQYEHIPQMRFSGSMNGMTKEVPKVLRFEYRGAKNYINDSMGSGKRESGVVHTGYAEVKWQGTSSIAFPKKNFTVKLFENEVLTTKKNVALRATWGEQNKYCMKANFIDSTQCRNVVSAKVWGDMVRSRNTSSESYIRMHDLPNAGAVDGYPILVFLNDQYVGLYTMNIPKDEWMFGMEDGEGTNVVLCAESWDSASTQFNEPAVINGSDWGYEVEPADKSWVVNSFNGIYNALALPHGTEQEKTAKRAALEAVVDIYSVIDYQIFLEALCLTDNTRKNQLLVTYDGTKWIMSAYDLDTAFAMHWSGTQYYRNDMAPGPNNLTDTVRTLYPTDYNERKTALKTGALDPKRILQSILNFAIDIPQEAYRAEAELWPDQCGANANAMQQIISFVMTRPELNS